MRNYELLFILKPTLTEEEAKNKVDFVKDIMTKNEVEIVSTNEMGVRKLAYPIHKYERGNYFVIYYKSNPGAIAEILRNIRITEEIIKFMNIKFESKKEIASWEKLSSAFIKKIEEKVEETTEQKAEEKVEEAAEQKAD